MRHSLTQLLAASGGGSPVRSESPEPAVVRARSPAPAPAPAPARAASGCEAERGDAGERGAGARKAGPPPEDMEEEALAGGPGEDADAMDFLSGLELADLLDPRPPDWPLEAGLGSPGPLSSSGGGSDGGSRWRGDDDDEAAAAEMQRFSDLLQRLLNGIGGGGGGDRSGGDKRRRKAPASGGGGDHTPAATRSPRKAAAAAARLNRLKKKEYVMGLESRVRGLAAENQELRAENRELGRRVQALQEESRYLRAVLANETGLARLLSRLSGVGLRLTTSLFRDAPAGDHDYALPVGKQPAEPREDDEPAGGVCLHVDKDKVSVEFCAACARKAASTLKM
ncbi:CREB/ATF bZIP transcription factor isoform X2 [Erinaceus europaeus]|uniref:CREB/ATF bZIP transcription factor isoform X2 n=1 Tax=Erinaceus europaeus TaxID=9365 RepID=A0ABM3W8H0_ERIEU|nr:CREB/ATF bZIP transcription factor isoform X2 [Erinaceus europaeus]XP_060032752.1 CREB/ATF bZIP transcription factor isoform X2 [Erinaceus europaeus]